MELLSVFSQTEELLCGVLGCAHSASVLQPNWRLFRLNISRLITVTLHRLSPLLSTRSNSSDLTPGWMFTANIGGLRLSQMLAWQSFRLGWYLFGSPTLSGEAEGDTFRVFSVLWLDLDTQISHRDNHTPHHILTYHFFTLLNLLEYIVCDDMRLLIRMTCITRQGDLFVLK